MLKSRYGNNSEEIQVGLDEAGRGCMIGSVFAGAVIWDPTVDPWEIKDSKKLTRKKRKIVKEYIEENAIAWSVGSATNEEIDEIMREDSVPAPSNEPSISKEEESLENNNFIDMDSGKKIPDETIKLLHVQKRIKRYS